MKLRFKPLRFFSPWLSATLVTSLLGACGQPGPLYLPAKPSAPPSSQARPAQIAPAIPSQSSPN